MCDDYMTGEAPIKTDWVDTDRNDTAIMIKSVRPFCNKVNTYPQ